jgi:GH43 family beta-xylosidase
MRIRVLLYLPELISLAQRVVVAMDVVLFISFEARTHDPKLCSQLLWHTIIDDLSDLLSLRQTKSVRITIGQYPLKN